MPNSPLAPDLAALLKKGLVIPAHPLALTAERRLDERHQRALTRYYLAAGVGGIAVGVHTTQFAIHDPKVGLLRPVLELARQTVLEFEPRENRSVLCIAGLCGPTAQAVAEARLARDLGYHAGLLSLGALRDASIDQLLAHARAVAGILPLFGFYLQPAAGGRVLDYSFWRRFAEIENLIAIKIAPFNRYQTLDVVRAVAESGRAFEIAVYTGNDDSIVADLLTPFRFQTATGPVCLRISGGLLGHWAVWTRRAVELLDEIHRLTESGSPIPHQLFTRATEITDTNAALFDPQNDFAGCIPGLHEVLCRQGLLAGRWCLDPSEDLSPGQLAEIDRVYQAYPHLRDDAFVAANLFDWLR